MKETGLACRICRSTGAPAGRKLGVRTGRAFELARCGSCGFAWVQDPWTDFAAIYDDRYYRGEGSDSSVDYAFEYENPELTVRRHEWSGVLAAIRSLKPDAHRWLDFGCGNGGLVRNQRTGMDIEGFDTGSWATRARKDGIPILEPDQLARSEGGYDVVTAIEVIEHVIDPIEFLQQVRRQLRPGGVFFLTTGNAARARARFCRWRYVNPEIHVSYFTPHALALAFDQTGFRAEFRGRVSGFRDIIRFKVLKGLRQRRMRSWHPWMPWRLFVSIADRGWGISAMPIGVAR